MSSLSPTRKIMFRRRIVPCLTALVATALTALPAHAEQEVLSQANANILWTLIAGILVMFMQAGFSCVECGFTRAKSAGNIIMKNFVDFGAGQITFLLFGFAIMFGTDAFGLFGTDQFALSGDALPGSEGFDGFKYTFWFFQSVFAATAATIVSGGIAERTKFTSYILISIVVTGLIYPVSGHWAWGSLNGEASMGWLESIGFTDFAGSTVVHSVGGWCALAGAMVLGPRVGKYTPDGTARAIPGHNIPLAALGVFILWFGWFGFNAGSTTTADATIGLIAVNTSLSASAGVIGAMLTAWTRFGKPDISMTLNGALAGLVGITAGCATVSPAASLVIGVISGIVCTLSVEFIDKLLRVDDPVGAVSVHGVCGAWGTLACGLFNLDGGLFYGGGSSLFFVQSAGVATIFLWSFGIGFLAFTAIKKLAGLRVKRDEELRGLDLSEHSMEAYSGFHIFSNE